MAGSHGKKDVERAVALGILGVGTLVSLASLLGNIWVVRAGVVVAVAMAFAAVFVAWRQLKREREEHAREVSHQLEVTNQLVAQHHERSVAMIERFTRRNQTLTEQIATLRRQLGAAKGELSSMRGNSAWLRGELAERQARIVELTARVQELEEQLNQAESSNVLQMPRRGTASVQPSAADIWADGEHPTMVDLASLQLDVALGERKQA